MSPTRFHCVDDALRGFNALPELSDKCHADTVRAGVATRGVPSEIPTGQDFDARMLQQVLSKGFVVGRRLGPQVKAGIRRGVASTGAKMGVTAANFSR